MNRNQPQASTDTSVRPKARRAKFDPQAVITWSLIVVVAGAVTVLLWRPFEKEPADSSFTPPGTLSAPVTLGSLASSSSITNPQPWQYDPATNQHWVADHGHWHSGLPPDPNAPSPTSVQLPPPIKGGSLPPSFSSTLPPGVTIQPSATTQPGVTPKPWEYNAATDKFWHPDHNHWHSGRPPANPTTTTAPATTLTPLPGTPGGEIPAPWYFDTLNNRHWNPDPGHAHWHPGPPPEGKGS